MALIRQPPPRHVYNYQTDRVPLYLCVRLQRHERARADEVAPGEGDVEPRGAVVPAQTAAVVALQRCLCGHEGEEEGEKVSERV